MMIMMSCVDDIITFNSYSFFMIRSFSLFYHKIDSIFYLSPLYHRCVGPDCPLLFSVLYFTGMAQRKRAGLITPRTLVRSRLPVSSIRVLYQKHAVIAMRR